MKMMNIVNVNIVKDASNYPDEYVLRHKNLEMCFSTRVNELIETNVIEDILMFVDSMILLEDIGIGNYEEFKNEYEMHITRNSKGVVSNLDFSIDDTLCFVNVTPEACEIIYNQLKVDGFKSYESIIYVEEIKTHKVELLAKSEDEVYDILNMGKQGLSVEEIAVDIDNYSFKTAYYEYGINEVNEIK